MVSSEVQRTLVKSPPELWAELSDPDALARHLGELGEIRITRVEPEENVEWEAARSDRHDPHQGLRLGHPRHAERQPGARARRRAPSADAGSAQEPAPERRRRAARPTAGAPRRGGAAGRAWR